MLALRSSGVECKTRTCGLDFSLKFNRLSLGVNNLLDFYSTKSEEATNHLKWDSLLSSIKHFTVNHILFCKKNC